MRATNGVTEATEKQTRKWLRRLRFPAELERAFQEDYYQRIRFSMRLAYAIGIVLLALILGIAAAGGQPLDGAAPIVSFWMFVFAAGIVLLTLLKHVWPWQPFMLVAYNFNLVCSALIDRAYSSQVHSTLTSETLLFSQSSLCIASMVGALAVMRVQWRWATPILISTLVQGSWSASRIANIPFVEAAAHFLTFGVSTLMFMSLTVYLYERSTREAFLANHLLGIERAKSDDLLHNVLPHSIADRLKGSSDIVADDHANVTVLFADVVDFTPFCAEKSAREVVGFLNDVFSRFDRLVERHGLEKIKTVGDCYMVIAGAPTPRSDHVEAIAYFALEMQAEARQIGEEMSLPVQFRIGIHTGPLVAGVIGEKRFLYDVWGDTVNTASRLESQGVPGRIHVSEEVAGHLRERFVLSFRGPVEIKGKGDVEVWFLDGEAPTPVMGVAVTSAIPQTLLSFSANVDAERKGQTARRFPLR